MSARDRRFTCAWRRLARTALATSGALLTLFHVWLFGGQALAGELSDPWLIAQWTLAGGLLLALYGLRRRGLSLFGRQSAAVWLLAALLHGSPVGADAASLVPSSLPEATITLIGQIASGLALGLLLLSSRGAATRTRLIPFGIRQRLDAPLDLASPRFALPYAPRPPPSILLLGR